MDNLFSTTDGIIGTLTKKYGFEISKVVLVAHGSQHNDTIATVKVKDASSKFNLDLD